MRTIRVVPRRGVLLAILVIAVLPANAAAQQHESIGTVDFPVSCSPEAQSEFNRGIALLHHMTYPRAREVFERVAAMDPGCAMANWGIAMTLFQPLWPTRPGPAQLQRGWELAQKASSSSSMTERERLLVDAVAAFFREPESADYWQRIRRWEEGMARAYEAFPDDPEVTAFYALAHLAAAPPDDRSVAMHSERAAELLTAVYRSNPDHPGAMHYLVHAGDAPGRERASLEATEKYATVAPRNPHALHMPTHIHTRLGNWNDVIRGNLLAAEAALGQPAGEGGQYVWDEFPHAEEYLIYAYLQQGADAEASHELERLQGTPRLDPTFKTAFHLASTRARYALERRDWEAAAAIVIPDVPGLEWKRFPWPVAVASFANGLGAVHLGRDEDARTAIDRLIALRGAATSAGEDLFARNIQILELELRAWVSQLEGDGAAGLAAMKEAAELEQSTPKHPVTPGPTLPAQELWGDLLLEQGNSAAALVAFNRSLELYPNRFNSLLGAARAAVAAGDRSAARSYYQTLLAVAAGTGRNAEREEAQRFVAGR